MKHLQKWLASGLAMTLALSCALPLNVSAAKSFSDVKGHWAADYIQNGVNRGYVNGYENGSFRPNGSVTRAEFCKMMNNALGLQSTTDISFTDVSSGDWFYNEVAKAVASGYISGYDDGSFRADDPITRQEAAVVISRIVSDAGSQKDIGTLRDSGEIASWALPGASTVYSKGYMGGDTQKKFNPNGNLTRGEAVKIIEGILGGEKINNKDTYVSTVNQSVSDQVYSGNITVSANGASSFQNCRILGTLSVTGEATVRLEDCKVGKIVVSGSAGKAEVIAVGNTDIHQTNLSAGASLTENGVYGKGFTKVNLSGSRLSSQDVTLTGAFTDVNLDSVSTLSLRGGSIQSLRLAGAASGSKINLLSGTRVERAELNGSGTFTGSGTIQLAVLNNSGSTFETTPVRMEGKTALIPTITPRNGATGVSVSDNILIRFQDIPYTTSNSVVTSSYVEGSVVELRTGSETGSKVSFDASLASNNREITIDPSGNLSTGTRYYIILKPALRNSRGEINDKTVYSFTTQNGLAPTVYPANGATGIPVSTSLRLEFGEGVYQPNGNSLTSSYLRDTALELRADSRSGSKLSISPSISSDRKTITISINSNLSTGRTYYLIVKGGTLANSSRETVGEQSYYFTTASSSILVPAMTPSPGSSKVSTGTDIVLDFDSTIYTSSGGSVSSSYLENNVFTLRRDSASGSGTSFRATVNSSSTRVTLTPDSSLRSNTTYYLVIADSSLANSSSSSRRYNDRIVLSFTTGTGESSGDLAPTPYPANGASGLSVDTPITLSFDTAIYRTDSYRNELSSSYLRNSVLELRSDSATGSSVDFTASISSNNRVITIRPDRTLSTNTRYYVIVNSGTIQNNSGLRNSKFTSYFTCGSTAALSAPSISPTDGSSGVSPSTNITFSFAEDVYDTGGNRLGSDSSSYAYISKYAVTLRAGSESGNLVLFNTQSIINNRSITIAPTQTLSTGTTYYVTLNEGYFRNRTGQNNKRLVYRFTVGSGLTVSTSPGNGQSSVSRTAPIVLYFSDPIYDSNLNAITDSYIKSNLSVSPGFSYSASLSNGNRTLTITPDSALEANRSYTITLPANRVANSSGYRNSYLSFSFSTNSTALVPTVSPANGSSNVAPGSSISLSFGETLYHPSNGTLLSNTDAINALELRRGGTTGTLTGFTANVSGSVITLTPSAPLERGSTYYVILKNAGMANSSRLQNSYQYFYFTTQPEINLPAPGMSIGSVKADGAQDVTVSFSSAVYQPDKTPVDAAYIQNNLKLKNGSTELTPSGVQISNNQTVILSYAPPTTPLLPGTTYTLSAAANVFSDLSGNKNSAISVSQTTPSPSVSLTAKTVGKTSASFQVSYDYPGTFSFRADPQNGGAVPTITQGSVLIPNEKSGSFTVDLSGMEEGKSYQLTLDYTYAPGGTPISKVLSFQTDMTSRDSSLSALSVQDTKFTHPVTPNSSTPTALAVTPGDVSVIPTAAAGTKAGITVNGVSVSSGAATTIRVESSPVEVTIVVTAEDGSQTSYALTLSPTAGS